MSDRLCITGGDMREHQSGHRGTAFAMLLASSALVLPATALAQTASTSSKKSSSGGSVSAQEGTTDEIVVTGQALPDAVIGDIPAENQLGQSEIGSYGVDSVSELLDELADQTTSVSGRDSSSGPVVLVNGKRVSGINEVGDLPVESVLRVDILPEEVAIKYGYDAQQKVVNIILKRRFESRVVNLEGGMSGMGGGETTKGVVNFTRIRDNDRFNLIGRVDTQAAIKESDRDITVDPDSTVEPANGISDDRAYRTLQSSTRNYILGAMLAKQLSSNANASFNLRGIYKTSRGLSGLATGDLTIPTDNPYYNGDGTLTRYLNDRALQDRSNSGSISAGGTVNVDFSKRWKLSVIGSYEHSESDSRSDNSYDLDAIQDALDANDPSVDPYGTLPSSLLGDVQSTRAKSNSDTGSASALVTGKLFHLPAGDMGVSLRLGGDVTSQSSSTTREGETNSSDANRTNGIAKLSVDLPLTSKSKGVLGALGTLSVNFNAGVTQVSDYGTLSTLGYGLNWVPVKGVTVIAAMNNDRSAPTVAQLNDPVTAGSNRRVYDYVAGESVLVTSITGGNPDLKADNRRSFKLGVTAQVMNTPKLNFSANYVDSRNRNAIMSLGAVTEEIEDAFPDRFERDADGTLTQVDSRPVNVYRQRIQQVRWGFNLSAELRKPKRPERPAWPRRGTGAAPGAPGMPGASGPGGPNGQPPAFGPQGAPGGQVSGEVPGQVPSEFPGQFPSQGTPPMPDGAQGVPPSAPPSADGQDITVTGQREQDAPPPPLDGRFPDGPPPGTDGFGPPPGADGFGPPPGGGPGGPGGGFGGAPGGGGPGGGFGGPGGPGGRGFGGGSDNGLRLMASVYHTWVLRQEVQLTEDGDTIDLLHGGTLTGDATPQHKISASVGVSDNGLGFRLEGNWQSATEISGATTSSGTGDLHFGSLTTLDTRIFANLQNRFPGKPWAKGMRVSLAVDNIFNTRQRVTDSTGTTPYAYQKDYLDPMGRTFKLSVRRIF